MSSLPAAIISGSYQSASRVIDAFESYRRTQTQYSDFVSGSLSSTSGPNTPLDAEAGYQEEEDNDYEDEYESRFTRERARRRGGEDAILENVQWDEDLSTDLSTEIRQFELPIQIGNAARPPHVSLQHESEVSTPRARAGEQTPLILRPSLSNGSLSHPPSREAEDHGVRYAAVQHKISSTSIRSKVSSRAKCQHTGQSTFAQTLINAIGVLFGIGMLSQPLAFSYAGWIGGTALILGYGFVSCYTAKILAQIVLQDPRIRSYADIGRKAFGPRSMPIISTIFALELFTVTVALVTLYADSLYAIVPTYSPGMYKVIGLTILIPAMLMPLSVLSYASIVGIFSLMGIIGIILFDGFTKFEAPGSLWIPADTSLGIDSYRELGVAFGLFMAGFAGHAVIPTLARDMIDPTRFDEMINWAFVIATGIYGVLGMAGYVMFGNSVSDEFSKDLMEYNTHPALNTIALWGLVLTPLSKFALSSRPLNITIEMLLGIDSASISEQSPAHQKLSNTLVTVERGVLAILSVVVSILVPEFASIMAVLGSTFSFLLCVIGPLSAKIALEGGIRNCEPRDGLLLAVTVSMALWGTFCAFETATLVP